MNPKLKDLIPMLMCDDTQQSIEFYTSVLGFQVTSRMDDVGKTGWASLNHGPVEIMLASPTYMPAAQKIDGRHTQMMLYFYPDDVEQLHASVRELGYPVSDLAVRFYGMKEFEVVDPSGHILVFGQETDEEPPPKP